jgi:hypothetical protein
MCSANAAVSLPGFVYQYSHTDAESYRHSAAFSIFSLGKCAAGMQLRGGGCGPTIRNQKPSPPIDLKNSSINLVSPDCVEVVAQSFVVELNVHLILVKQVVNRGCRFFGVFTS